MNKKWKLYEKNYEKVDEYVEKFKVSKLVAKILINREIEESKIPAFLNPVRNDFYDPFLMPDMEKAVERVIKAIENKEKVIVYGDYDTDGITSVTVIKRYLAQRKLEVDYYIPNRLTEGYGLNKTAIDKIVEDGYQLMITVDCGISAIEEVEYANKLGLDVIVTDHHEPGEILPPALAVVDAKREDNKYPFNQLAGVGVAYKLIQAITIKLELDPAEYLRTLDIVGVGTISDIVPLVDENRTISKLGLRLLNFTRNLGLFNLIKIGNFKRLDSGSVSFGLAPRINASGRMGHEQDAIKLFLTKDAREAEELAKKLNEYNIKRQDIEKQMIDEVLEKAELEKDKKCIILGSDKWHHGVIGIVASKVTERFHKPTILVCFEDGVGKGSGRSIEGIDLYQLASKSSKYLENFGGHSMAIGLTVNKENFEKFKEDIENNLKDVNLNEIIPTLKIEADINLKDVTIDVVRNMNVLEPYGADNPKPIFIVRNLRIVAITTMTEGKHLKMMLRDENGIFITAVGFGIGDMAEQYQIGDKVDIAGNLEINNYKFEESIQFTIRDIRESLNIEN